MPPFDPEKFLRETEGKPITVGPDKVIAPKNVVGQPGFDPETYLRERGTVSGGVPSTKPEERTVGERLQTGFADPFYGMAQLGARLGETESVMPLPQADRDAQVAAIDKQVAEREKAIQKRAGEGVDWWRLVGQGANPTLYAPALVGGLPGAALTGIWTAVTQPQADHTENFAERKAKDAVMGGIFGVGGAGITNVAGRVVSPVVGHAAQELLNRGVSLTPGRLAGQMMSRMEDAARSIPWLGHFIRNAQERSLQGYNLAAINTMLDPIGATLPRGVAPGHEAMDAAHTLIDAEYRRLLARPNLRMQIDQDFVNDLGNIMYAVNELPHPMQQQFQTILRQRLGDRLTRGATMQQGVGAIDGQTLQDVQSAFGDFERRYMRSGDPDQRAMGVRFGEVREAILDALQRQNPMTAGEFRDLRNSYAMFIRLQEASTRRAGAGGQEGLFTPMDLGAAVKKTDPSRRKAGYARGDALMQEFAEWGQFVLPSRLPDSGTPERWLWTQLFGGAAGGHTMLPSVADPYFLKAAGAAGLAATPYSRAGQALINYYADSAPWRRAIRNGLQTVVPAVGVPAGQAAMQFDASGNLIPSAGAMEAPLRNQLPADAIRVERERQRREAEAQ